MNSAIEIFSAHDVIMHFPLTPEDRTLNMSPWFHRGGLYCAGPNPTFYLGSSLVPMRAFDAETALDWVERYRLTFLIGAPTNLAMLATAQQARPRDLSSLRGIVTMGAPLEREAALRYQEILTPRVFNGYGSTEGFWNTFLRPTDLPAHAGTAGRACIDDDVRVVRVHDDGRLASPDEVVARDGVEVGEVIIRSPKCAAAYFDSPQQPREAGVSVGLFYKYFGGKEEILLAAIVDILEKFRDQLAPAMELAGDDPVEQLMAGFREYVAIVDANRDAVVLTYRESRTLDAGGRERIKQLEVQTSAPMRGAITAAIAAGLVHDDVDADLVVFDLMMLAHGWALKHWHFAPDFDLDGYVTTQLRIALRALVTHDHLDRYLAGL